MHKWGLASSVKCECGASEQTADHIILTSPYIWRLENEWVGQFWMAKQGAGSTPLLPTSDLGNTAGWGGKRINPQSQSFSCI